MSSNKLIVYGNTPHPAEPTQILSYVGTSFALTLIQEAATFYTDALQDPESMRALERGDVIRKLGERLAYPLFRSIVHSGLCKCVWIGVHSQNYELSRKLFDPLALTPKDRRRMIESRGAVAGRITAANRDAARTLYAGVVPSLVGVGIDWVEIAAEYLAERAKIVKQKKAILAAEKDEARRAKKKADMERRVSEIGTEKLLWAGRVVLRSARYQLAQGGSTWVSSVLFGATAWADYAETVMGLVGSAVLM